MNASPLKTKGFTLIELLVVVAIIGILATVVLASLGSARTRAKDARIRTLLNQMRVQAEVQYLENGNYNDICEATSDSGKLYRLAYQDAGSHSANSICRDENSVYGQHTLNTSNPYSSTPTGTGTFQGWAAEIKLNNGNFWFCIDGNGNIIEADTGAEATGRQNLETNNTCGDQL